MSIICNIYLKIRNFNITFFTIISVEKSKVVKSQKVKKRAEEITLKIVPFFAILRNNEPLRSLHSVRSTKRSQFKNKNKNFDISSQSNFDKRCHDLTL